MRRPAYRAALCGVLAALAVAIMTLGTIIPVATFCCPALCGILLIPVLDLCGAGLALCWYAAVGILSLLLAPDKEAALVFLFLGYYPVLRPALQRLRKPLRLPVKLAFFNASSALLCLLLWKVLGLPSFADEFRSAGTVMLIVFAAVANLTFVLYDLVLVRMTGLWAEKRKKILRE